LLRIEEMGEQVLCRPRARSFRMLVDARRRGDGISWLVERHIGPRMAVSPVTQPRREGIEEATRDCGVVDRLEQAEEPDRVAMELSVRFLDRGSRPRNDCQASHEANGRLRGKMGSLVIQRVGDGNAQWRDPP
jgi:hypothetical protein